MNTKRCKKWKASLLATFQIWFQNPAKPPNFNTLTRWQTTSKTSIKSSRHSRILQMSSILQLWMRKEAIQTVRQTWTILQPLHIWTCTSRLLLSIIATSQVRHRLRMNSWPKKTNKPTVATKQERKRLRNLIRGSTMVIDSRLRLRRIVGWFIVTQKLHQRVSSSNRSFSWTF